MEKKEKIPKGAKAEKIIEEMKKRDKESGDLWSNIHTEYNRSNRFVYAKDGQFTQEEADRMGEPRTQENRVLAFVNFIVNQSVKQDIGCMVEPVSQGADAKLAKVRQAQIMKAWSMGKGKQAAAAGLRQAISGGFGVIFQAVSFADNSTQNKKIEYKYFKDPTVFKCDPAAQAPALIDMKYAIIKWQLSKGSYENQFGEWEEMGRKEGENWESGEKKTVFEYWRIVKNGENLYTALDGKDYKQSELEGWDEQPDENGKAFTPKPDLGDDPAARRISNDIVEQYIVANNKIHKKTIWPGCRLPFKVVEGREVWKDGMKSYQPMSLHAEGPQRKLNFLESQKLLMYSKGPLEMVFVPAEGDSVGLEAKVQEASRNGSKNVIVIPYKSRDEQGQPLGAPIFRPQLLMDPQLASEAVAAVNAIEACFGIKQGAFMARPADASGVSIHATEDQADTANSDYIENWITADEELFRDTLYILPKLGISMQLKLAGDDQKEETVWVNNQAYAMQSGVQNYDLDEDEEYGLTLKVGPAPKSMRDKSFDQDMQYAKEFPMIAPMIADIIARNSLSNTDSDLIADRAHRFVAQNFPWALSENPDPKSAALMQQIQMGQKQVQQMQQAMTAMQGQAEQKLAALQMQLAGLKADKSNEALKIQLEYEAKEEQRRIDAFNALTDRKKVDQAEPLQAISPASLVAKEMKEPETHGLPAQGMPEMMQ